jgi:hypothetical protein
MMHRSVEQVKRFGLLLCATCLWGVLPWQVAQANESSSVKSEKRSDLIEGVFVLSSIEAANPPASTKFVFTRSPGSSPTTVILWQSAGNQALQQGASYKIVASVSSTHHEEVTAKQVLAYVPSRNGYTVPLWLNAPGHEGLLFEKSVGYLKMAIPYENNIAIL